MKCGRVRLSTWNLEWVERDETERSRQAKVLERIGADIWVLTEARPSVLPEGLQSTSSADIPSPGADLRSRADAGCFAVVGARDLKPLSVPELPTAACALVPVAGETWLALGICMPWLRNAPPLPDGTAPAAHDGPAQWRTVLTRLDAALERLAPRVGRERVLLAGDLNQTLSDDNIGFAGGREALEKLLRRHRLRAYTAEEPSLLPDCATVDHLCGPAVPHQVGGWPRSATALSDHRGYTVTLH